MAAGRVTVPLAGGHHAARGKDSVGSSAQSQPSAAAFRRDTHTASTVAQTPCRSWGTRSPQPPRALSPAGAAPRTGAGSGGCEGPAAPGKGGNGMRCPTDPKDRAEKVGQ